MENQQQQQQLPLYEHQNLSNEFISEYDLALFLGITQGTLSRLRTQQSLPYIRLDKNNRLYQIKALREWLDKRLQVIQ